MLLLLTACTAPSVRVVAVDELGEMSAPDGIVGRDGGVSARLGDVAWWVYGDTVVDEAGTFPNTWRNNTAAYTADFDAADGVDGWSQPLDADGAPDEFFPRTEDEAAYNDAHLDDGDCEDPCGARYAIWGGAPLWDDLTGQAFLPYGQVQSAPGDWNFWINGTSLATMAIGDLHPTRPTTDATLDDPTLLFDADAEGEYAIGVVSDGYLWLYACSGWPEDGLCRLARAPTDAVLTRSAWRAWDGDAWSGDITEAKGLFAGSPNLTVQWDAAMGVWIAVYADWGTIVLRTAAELTGPWSETLTVATPDGDDLRHAGAHAELQEDDGRVIYVSYLVDTFHLLRVELEAA